MAAAATGILRPLLGTETVLLVEDDPEVQSLLLRVLVQAGYEVSLAGDGAEALVVAARMDVPADLLITDLIMPRMGGRELASQLQFMYPALRVIYTSGYTQETALYDDAKAGRVTFVQKPFNPNDVLQTVRTVLARPTAAPVRSARGA
jgi:two-component system cell cycle sensor histidine kinase/response regulator CckA